MNTPLERLRMWSSILFGLLGLIQTLPAQEFILIEQLPDYTPVEDSIFLCGAFNDWNPQDPNYQFSKVGEQYILGPLRIDWRGGFKVTRGAWSSVEGSRLGQPIENRRVDTPGDTIRLEIESWEDLDHMIPYRRQVEVVVNHLPTSTPEDASVYIAGTFNEWNPGDESFKLKAAADGTFRALIPIHQDSVGYKFTRGKWSSVEGNRSGRARTNRLYVDSQEKGATIYVAIATWEDLSGDPINAYTFLLLLAAFQGFLLIIAINTIQENNLSANRLLSLLILLISLAIIARVSIYSREIFQWQPKILLLPDLIYFLYGPVFLAYIQRLLTLPVKRQWSARVLLLPFLLQLLCYLPLFLMDHATFTSRVVDLSLKKYFILSAFLAWAFNLFYAYRGHLMLQSYEANSNANYSFEQNVQYLQTVVYLSWCCLLIWGLTYLIGGMGWLLEWDTVWWTDKLTDLVWVGLATTVFFLGYFSIKQPEILRLADVVSLEEEDQQVAPLLQAQEGIDRHQKQLLLELMEREKPYLNPRLTLSDLAHLLHTNVHQLSKLINEGFDKNFYDFINGYRVQEFKRRVVLQEYKNQTLLAVAFSVGFNSKTAFNRSFKKLTKRTPRQFLKSTENQSDQPPISIKN